MKHTCPQAAALVLLLLLVGCGSGYTYGAGTVTVIGLAPGQTLFCGSGSATVQFTGSGFLSEHGVDITVRWDALQGTPFQGGTAATEETPGTVLSDTLFDAVLPNAFGSVPCTVTIILPGQNEGTSPPITLEIGGDVFGPFAYRDDYTSVGNVTLTVDAAGGVLPNDEDSFCGEGEPEKIGVGGRRSATNATVVGYQGMTTLGGTVTMAPDGSFTYNPPLGVGLRPNDDGIVQDTFTYTIEEPGRPTSTAVVHIDLCEVVWFIDDTAPAGGDGSMASPFSTTTAFNAQQLAGQPDDPQEGDWIYVYRGNSGTTPLDDGLTLKPDQKLIGQGVDLVVCDQLIVAAGQPPVLTNTGISIGEPLGGPVVWLSDRNIVRGIQIDGGSDGILGFDVFGPTVIDMVGVRNCSGSGIRLDSVFGPFLVGAALTPGAPRVDIRDTGLDGIRIGGTSEQVPGLRNAATGLGASLTVGSSTISGCLGTGIFCIDANLAAEAVVIDNVPQGIYFESNAPGICDALILDSQIGASVPCGFRGIQLMRAFGGITASIQGCEVHATEQALLGRDLQGYDAMQIAIDNSTFQTLVTVPIYAVDIDGGEVGSTVTSLANNVVIGNGQGGGMTFGNCRFDANPATGATETVSGGTTALGQGPAARVEFTALAFFSCNGALDYDDLTIFQVGGDPSGIVNAGILALSVTALSVDHVP